MTRTRALTAAAGVLATGLTALAPTAQAHPAPTYELRTIKVSTTYTLPPGDVDGVGCSWYPSLACSLHLHGTETMRGTLSGTGDWDAVVTPRADGDLAFTGNNYMQGRIAGCGDGGFIYEDLDGVIFTKRFDPATQSFPAHNRWRIRAQSTTGELATRFVSGSGTQVWRSFPLNRDPAQENWGRGVITGTIICRQEVTS